MKRYRVYGRVIGSIYMGIYEAENKSQVKDLASNDYSISLGLCHQCASLCEEATVDNVECEEITDPDDNDD